jgi:hypothetical protein
MHHFLAIHQCYLHGCFQNFSYHTRQKFDLLISLLGKPCKSTSSRSGTSFLHNLTSITEFMTDLPKICHKNYSITGTKIVSPYTVIAIKPFCCLNLMNQAKEHWTHLPVPKLHGKTCFSTHI